MKHCFSCLIYYVKITLNARTRVFMPTTEKSLSTSLLAEYVRDYHKTSSNNEVHEEIVHVEKSNYGEVSLGPTGLCL